MHAQKTVLTQVDVWTPSGATAVFNRSDGETIPIVAVPWQRVCCSCYFSVPSGAYTIIHDCGKDDNPDGLADAGIHCTPYWKHVAYMVTQQSITYNAPVKACPTSDDVTVDCELTLVFSIGPGADDVKKFVYNLGVVKFNQFLAAECEEAVRQLMRATMLEDVYELRGAGSEHVAQVLRIMNDKFNPFGVTFVKAAITDVMLNSELRQILQGTTEFRTKITELDKEDDFNMKNIGFEFTKRFAEKEREYDRRKQDISAETSVAMVNRDMEAVQAESRREVAVTRAEEAAEVGKTRADADLKVAKSRAQRENADLLSKIRSQAEADRIHVEHDCLVRVKESEGLIAVEGSKAEATKVEAKGEGEAAKGLTELRKHSLRMARLEVVEAVARRSKMVVGGDEGRVIIQSVVNDALLGDFEEFDEL